MQADSDQSPVTKNKAIKRKLQSTSTRNSESKEIDDKGADAHRKPAYRHSISYMMNSQDGDGNAPKLERRSSFASPSSSFARRRSFLSPSMISNEKHTVYELHNGMGYNTPSFSISLKESQGFSWNQDLFASQYQQQSSAVYDDDDDVEDEDQDDVVDDEETDYEYEGYDGSSYRHGNSRSLSMSNENGYKVRVIDIKVDEDENIFQVET